MDVQSALDEAVAMSLPGDDAPVQEIVDAPVAPEPELDDAASAVAAAEAAGKDADPEDASEEESDAPVVPEGYVAPEIIGELATSFVLYDAEGEVEVPNLMVKYQANGKERNDRLDQVVKMAQWGVYNQERDQKAKQVEIENKTLAEEREALQAVLQEREEQLERILQDEDFLFAVREAYEQENSPERRAERAEERVRDAEVRAQLAPIAQEGQRFYASEVAPALQRIAQVLPTIRAEELDQRMALAMQAHAEIGPHGQPIVTPAKYDALRQYIVEDLAVWAKAMHEYRTEGRVGKPTVQASPKAQPDPALIKAQREAQQAKNTLAKAIKPSGTPPTKERRAPSNAPAATVDEALESAMASVLSGITR
jgi:hypothetical protein